MLRYETETGVDGLPPGEGAFLACSFWLADNYLMLGRTKEAMRLFNRLKRLPMMWDLFAEEYDPVAKRMLGNFPQAFSHVALINTRAQPDAGRRPRSMKRTSRARKCRRRQNSGHRCRRHRPQGRHRRHQTADFVTERLRVKTPKHSRAKDDRAGACSSWSRR